MVIKKFHLIFFITLGINVYFFVTELINFISSDFKAALSLCAAIMYFMTIVFISAIEFLKTFKINPYWAYFTTLLFLVGYVTILPTVLLVGGLTKSMDMVYSLSAVFNTFAVVLLVFFYVIYLVVRVIIPLIKSLISRIIRDDYGRCRNFGNIVINSYTFLIFIFSLGSAMFLLGFSEQLFFNQKITFLFVVPAFIIIFNLTVIFIVKCIKGMSKVSKRK